LAQRIDKWLVYARFVRHRARAQELIEGGQVRINRERVLKSSQPVKCNDVVTLVIAGQVIVLRVMGEAERRGPPASAAGLYQRLGADEAPHGRAAQKQDAPGQPLC
jgi:ribosome-associated heat shock protein Hsp15